MAEVTNELLLEVLKPMQTDMTNLYAGQNKIEAWLERIEKRLDLVGDVAE